MIPTAGHGLDRVRVDDRVQTAGQDRAVGQPGERGARGGGHHVGLEDGPPPRVGVREQLGQGPAAASSSGARESRRSRRDRAFAQRRLPTPSPGECA